MINDCSFHIGLHAIKLSLLLQRVRNNPRRALLLKNDVEGEMVMNPGIKPEILFMSKCIDDAGRFDYVAFVERFDRFIREALRRDKIIERRYLDELLAKAKSKGKAE